MRVATPARVATAVWLVTAPVAFLLPELADLNPFNARAAGLAFGSGLAAVALGTAVVLRWPWRGWPGVAAGLLASWTILVYRTALAGTPFGYQGVEHDAGRISAMATRYSTTWVPADAWIPGQPSEYPPLFFLVTGRVAALIGEPAWRVLPYVAAVVLSATVVLAFTLWRRLLPGWVALAIVAVAVLAYLDPRKPYETLTLAVVVPWALAVFGTRGRLHWLPAGILGALIVTTYQAWLVFGFLGIVAIAVLAWRAAPDRRAYLRHVGLVALTTVVLSAWYVVPYEWAVLTRPSQVVADRYLFTSLHRGFFPFLEATPLGVLQLVGLAGLVWFRRAVWWATPLLALAVGALLYRVLAVVRFVASGHTSFMQYSSALVVATLTAAGILVAVHVVSRVVVPAGVAAGALALLLGWTAYTVGIAWLPTVDAPSSYAVQAHLEPLPDGRYPRYAPAENRLPWFPVDPVVRAVGPDRGRVSLSYDERLYAFVPWPGYIGTSRTASGTLSRWDERAAEIAGLAATTDPAEFARASAQTRFGPIDIFVLHVEGGSWLWRTVAFSPDQFDPAQWTVVDDLPADTVVAVRR